MNSHSMARLPAVPIGLEETTLDETVPRLGTFMAGARSSFESEVPYPPSVSKLPREIDRSSHSLDSAGGPPPPIPNLSQAAPPAAFDSIGNSLAVQIAPDASRRRQL